MSVISIATSHFNLLDVSDILSSIIGMCPIRTDCLLRILRLVKYVASITMGLAEQHAFGLEKWWFRIIIRDY